MFLSGYVTVKLLINRMQFLLLWSIHKPLTCRGSVPRQSEQMKGIEHLLSTTDCRGKEPEVNWWRVTLFYRGMNRYGEEVFTESQRPYIITEEETWRTLTGSGMITTLNTGFSGRCSTKHNCSVCASLCKWRQLLSLLWKVWWSFPAYCCVSEEIHLHSENMSYVATWCYFFRPQEVF